MKNTRLFRSNDLMVRLGSGGGWDYIYQTSLIKDPRWNIGDGVSLPDGREFRYAKSSAACKNAQGCEFVSAGYTAVTTATITAVIGATSVTHPAATHAALTQDELAGGYVILYSGVVGDINTTTRGIVGNDAADANALFVVYLDAPLFYEFTASTSKIEAYTNPFANVRTGTDPALPKAGVPAVYVSAASMYFWVQTKGVIFALPGASVTGRGGVGVYWGQLGDIVGTNTALAVTTAAGVTSQYAGHCIQGTYDGNGPLILLK